MSIEYANIESFFEYNNTCFCFVNKFVVRDIKFNNELNSIVYKYASKFFVYVHLSNIYELVPFEFIQGKCIIVHIKKELDVIDSVLSPCVGFEHD